MVIIRIRDRHNELHLIYLAGGQNVAWNGIVPARETSLGGTVERWETLCRELDQPPERVALAWLLKNPIVTAPIIGPRTIKQLGDCLNVLPVTLDDDAWKKVEEIRPGPGGEAPEAYAW